MPIEFPSVEVEDGTAAVPFASYVDPEGNLWISPGPVIALHGTTVIFDVGTGGLEMGAPSGGGAFSPAGGQAAQCLGGNGTNVKLATGPLDAVVPFGVMRASAENEWTAVGSPSLVLTFDPGDGSAEIHDGIAAVATLAAGVRSNPAGTYTATTHGEDEYNLGGGFTVAVTYEGAADFFPLRRAALVWSDDSTAQAGFYERTGWQEWTSEDVLAWVLTLDGTGAGEITDGTGVVAERAADADRLHDPTGQWVATTYGTTTYGSTVPVYEATASAGTFPTQAYELSDTVGTVETWTGTTDGAIYIEFDSSDGAADIYDGTGLVATRTSGGTLADFLGTYTATTQGKDDYHGGAAFTIAVTDTPEPQAFLGRASLLPGTTAAGVAYVALTVDGDDEVTSVAGPILAASLPANTSYDKYLPLLTSDGSGVIRPRQLGPIYWKPGLAGAAGTGLAWVSLTTAAYAALGTPDADTIYDITDYP